MVRGRYKVMKKKSCVYKKLAQASIEYLLIVGFALAMTLPILLIFNTKSREINEDVTYSQTNKIADEIITAIDSVYYLGEPSSKTIRVYFPSYIKNVDVRGRSISFFVESSYGDYEVVKWSATNLTGSMRNFQGVHVITVIANKTNVTIYDR